eukprot:gene14240-16804_t
MVGGTAIPAFILFPAGGQIYRTQRIAINLNRPAGLSQAISLSLNLTDNASFPFTVMLNCQALVPQFGNLPFSRSFTIPLRFYAKVKYAPTDLKGDESLVVKMINPAIADSTALYSVDIYPSVTYDRSSSTFLKFPLYYNSGSANKTLQYQLQPVTDPTIVGPIKIYQFTLDQITNPPYYTHSYMYGYQRQNNTILTMDNRVYSSTTLMAQALGRVVSGTIVDGQMYARTTNPSQTVWCWDNTLSSKQDSTTITIPEVSPALGFTMTGQPTSSISINGDPTFADLKFIFNSSSAGLPFYITGIGEMKWWPIYPLGFESGRSLAYNVVHSFLVKPFSQTLEYTYPQYSNIGVVTFLVTSSKPDIPNKMDITNFQIDDLRNGMYRFTIVATVVEEMSAICLSVGSYPNRDIYLLDKSAIITSNSTHNTFTKIITLTNIALADRSIMINVYIMSNSGFAESFTQNIFYTLYSKVPNIPISIHKFTSMGFTNDVSAIDVASGPFQTTLYFTLDNNDPSVIPWVRIEPQFQDDFLKAEAQTFKGAFKSGSSRYEVPITISRGELNGKLNYTLLIDSLRYESSYLHEVLFTTNPKPTITSATDNLPPMIASIAGTYANGVVDYKFTLDASSVADFKSAMVNITSDVDPVPRVFDITTVNNGVFQITFTVPEAQRITQTFLIDTLVTEDTANNHGIFKYRWPLVQGESGHHRAGIDVVDPLGFIQGSLNQVEVTLTEMPVKPVDDLEGPSVNRTSLNVSPKSLHEQDVGRVVSATFQVIDTGGSGLSLERHIPVCYLHTYPNIILFAEAKIVPGSSQTANSAFYTCEISVPDRWGIYWAVWSVYGLVDNQFNIGSLPQREGVFIPIVDGLLSVCPVDINNVACSGNGVCRPTGCECNKLFTGPICGDVLPPTTIVVSPKTPQTTLETIVKEDKSVATSIQIIQVHEINPNSDIVVQYNLTDWKPTQILNTMSYKAVDMPFTIVANITTFTEEKVIEFAGFNITTIPGSIKISASIEGYTFAHQLNSLRLVLVAEVTGQDDSCTASSSDTNQFNGEMTWMKIQMNGQSVYGRFIDRGLIDGRPTKVVNKIIDNNKISGDSMTSITKIGIEVPYFIQSAIIDPVQAPSGKGVWGDHATVGGKDSSGQDSKY